MKPKTSPTSPKYALEQESTLKNVWAEQNIQPPARVPLLTVMLWSLIFSIVGLVVLVGGFTWYLRSVPNTRLKNFLPTTVTTIIENSGGSSTEAPRAVQSSAETVVPLLLKPGSDGVTSDAQMTGTAVVLSSSGWLMTVDAAIPAGATVVGAASDRTTMDVIRTVRDTASGLVFLKVDNTNVRAADFATSSKVKDGESVWVIVRRLTATVALRRQLLPAAATWQSCEQISPQWVLDEPVTAPLGSPVVNDNGQLVGILGTGDSVWAADSVEPILSTLFEQGTVDRISCGFRYISTTAIIGKNQPSDGLLIGAAAGQVAVDAKSAADAAGLKAGDIITAVDGAPVTSWRTVIQRVRPGSTLTLTIRRGERAQEKKISFGLKRL